MEALISAQVAARIALGNTMATHRQISAKATQAHGEMISLAKQLGEQPSHATPLGGAVSRTCEVEVVRQLREHFKNDRDARLLAEVGLDSACHYLQSAARDASHAARREARHDAQSPRHPALPGLSPTSPKGILA